MVFEMVGKISLGKETDKNKAGSDSNYNESKRNRSIYNKVQNQQIEKVCIQHPPEICDKREVLLLYLIDNTNDTRK